MEPADTDVVVDRRGEHDGGRHALVLPGLNFTADRPVLHYTIRTLLSHRWAVDVVRWRPPGQTPSSGRENGPPT